MIEIKRASERDALVLADIGRSTFVETFAKDNRKEDIDLHVAKSYSAEIQLDEIRDPSRRIEIAWCENSAVGYFHLFKSKPDPCVTGPKPLELLRIYVDARWHGKGVGGPLMEKAIETARTEKFQTLWLGVWERNLKAQAFYRKFGFTVVGTHVFQLGAQAQTDFIMARAI